MKARGSDYGHPKQNFDLIAKYWTTWLGFEIKSEDVPMMMILTKVARQQHKHKLDNLDDIQGYAETRKMLE